MMNFNDMVKQRRYNIRKSVDITTEEYAKKHLNECEGKFGTEIDVNGMIFTLKVDVSMTGYFAVYDDGDRYMIYPPFLCPDDSENQFYHDNWQFYDTYNCVFIDDESCSSTFGGEFKEIIEEYMGAHIGE